MLVPDPEGNNLGNIAITATVDVGGTVTMTCSDDDRNNLTDAGDISMTATPVTFDPASGPATRSVRSGLHTPPLPPALRAAFASRGRGPRSASHP